MKINDIKTGNVVMIVHNVPCLVIDIGLYQESYNNADRVIDFAGINFNISGRWYEKDTYAKQRRIVMIYLDSRTNARLTVQHPGKIQRVLSQEEAAEILATFTVRASIEDRRSRLTQRAGEYSHALTEILTSIAGTSNRDFRQQSPWSVLASSEIIKPMTMLWLRYHQQRNEPINGIEDVETLIESLKDAVRGLEETKTQTALSESDARALMEAEKARIDTSKPFVVRTATTVAA